METWIIPLVAFLAAILTFFSGFGLGTLLTPVFMVFFPVDLAIAFTGIVHFFNNIFKVSLVGRFADKKVLFEFGIPAIIMAFAGSWIMIYFPDKNPIYTYHLGNSLFEVMPFKLLVSILLIMFACIDLMPYFQRLQFSRDKLALGGVLSGFFGGLTGNQGALRSAFLIKAGLSKESFIGTAVVVSCFVDMTRLGVYAAGLQNNTIGPHWNLLILATIAGIMGSFIGNTLLKKLTLSFIKNLVAILLIVLSIALGAGWL